MYIKIEHDDQIDRLVDLAEMIWRNHFGTMFGPDDLERLINIVQSKEAILAQIQEGVLYYFIEVEGREVGYFAYKINEDQKQLFLSKIYIFSTERGKGLAREVMDHLAQLCKKQGFLKMVLTVFNKNDGAVKVYEKLGFKKVGSIERDFDLSVQCVDYVMEKVLKGK